MSAVYDFGSMLQSSRARGTAATERRLTRLAGDRADEKMASEYNLEGGATLHLVLALRGGF